MRGPGHENRRIGEPGFGEPAESQDSQPSSGSLAVEFGEDLGAPSTPRFGVHPKTAASRAQQWADEAPFFVVYKRAVLEGVFLAMRQRNLGCRRSAH